MGKKKSLNLMLSLFKAKESSSSPWQQLLPSCGHNPRTISFRAVADNEIFKTVNSIFFDPAAAATDSTVEETPESWFTTTTTSSEEERSRRSFSTESDGDDDGESLETLVRGVVRSSERLFFEPGENNTSSILEKAKVSGFPFKESVVLAMESEDPYGDFRNSMEEMVESHGVTDWEGLEELLCWYLRVNGKRNHGFIVGAFVDLLVSLAASSNSESNSCSDSTATAYCSAVSSLPSSPLCVSEGSSSSQNEIVECHDGNEQNAVAA